MKIAPTSLCAALAALALTLPRAADGANDNSAENVRSVPPPGIAVLKPDKDALTKGLAELQTAIDAARKAQAKNPRLADLLPDVEIFYKAVDWAMRYDQFNKGTELKAAYEQLAEGKARAAALKQGQTPWTQAKGLVVRGYRSKIDGSVQPYGMVIPESYTGAPSRLDFWIHGRGETLSEMSFVDQRMHSPGQVLPANALVLHPYGRYCCANKFAGEVDLFEALEHAKKFYAIDPNRVVMRGFSMGGAAAWQFSTHFADHWCAANPGAGFAETPEFLKVFQNEDVENAPWYQKKLWHWYNSSEYALNLFNTPTIAYSGEIDKQKQAADVMERELKKEGLDMLHIIGPKTAHALHKDSLKEIERRLAAISEVGRNAIPKEVHFTTWTLIYDRMEWITVEGMGEEWERARVDAVVKDPATVEIKTQNVTALLLNFESGHCPISVLENPTVEIDGQKVAAPKVKTDRSWQVELTKASGSWTLRGDETRAGIVKRHGLCGPIDDAFMDAFEFVTPTGKPLNDVVGAWVTSELEHAQREWRKQFRGDAPTKKDTEVKDEDFATKNIVLWGDPSSNAVLKSIADKLPVQWTEAGIQVGGKTYTAADHVPVLIFPNPRNPSHYVVLNSGFTYREYDYLNNARQVAKLPDWAVLDLSEKPNATAPGKVVDAGFFDEKWQVKAEKK